VIGLLWVILTSELVSIPFAIHAIATRRRESTGTLAWVGWLFFPIAGPLLYLFLGTDRIGRRRRRRVQELRALHRSHVEKAKECAKMRRAEFPSSLPVAISDQGFFALTFGNACDLLTKGDDVFKRMIEDIEGATRSVDILSYIIDADPQTDRIKDALLNALGRGVAVRIIYDGIGARGSDDFLKDLRARGAKCSEFIPLNVLKLRFRMSLRNHRKIAIVDESIGYIGSMNLSGRHAGEYPESQDIVVRVRGPVVEDMRRVFNEDWRFGELERRSHLLRADPELSTFDAVDDGPTDACALGERHYNSWRAAPTILRRACSVCS
jgi:cardiolipin synthase